MRIRNGKQNVGLILYKFGKYGVSAVIGKMKAEISVEFFVGLNVISKTRHEYFKFGVGMVPYD